MSRTRAHLVGYLGKAKLTAVLEKALFLGMDLTVCPSVYGRLGNLWKSRLGNGYISRSTKPVHETFRQLLTMQKNIRDVQQILFNIHGYKLRIKTLQSWIMQERYRRRPTDIHYWSVNW